MLRTISLSSSATFSISSTATALISHKVACQLRGILAGDDIKATLGPLLMQSHRLLRFWGHRHGRAPIDEGEMDGDHHLLVLIGEAVFGLNLRR